MSLKSIQRLVIGLIVLSACSRQLLAASVVADALPREIVRRAARSEVPALISSTRTLEAKSLRELIKWTAPVAKSAPLRYGDFASYWAVSNQTGQRSGKAFEAVLAWRENASAMENRFGTKVLVTSVEGFPAANSDLVRIGRNGEVLQHYQAKLSMNLRKAHGYLIDPRYQGRTLVTTRESYERVLIQLQRKELDAARRGIALDPKWQKVRDAIASGRLPGTWAGKPLPSWKGLDELARQATSESFSENAAVLSPTNSQRRLLSLGAGEQVLKRSLYLIDVATTGYLEYRDIDRYMRAEIGAGRLAAKSGIRVVQVSLATYSLTSPEPVSKAVTGMVVVVILAVDVATDIFFERSEARQEEAARRILASIERGERYHAVRANVLASFAQPMHPSR